MSQPEALDHSSTVAKKFRSIKQWIVANWMEYVADNLGVAYVSFSAGFLVAILLRIPLFPWAIPKDDVPIFTSCASAFIGAGLAAVIARRTLVRGDAEARKTVSDVIREVANQLATVEETLVRENTDLANYKEFRTIYLQFHQLKNEVTHAIDRLKLLSSSHAQIRFGRGVAIPDAQLALNAISTKLDKVTDNLDSDREGAQANRSARSNNKIGLHKVNSTQKAFDKELRPQLQKLDAALLRLGHPRNSLPLFYDKEDQENSKGEEEKRSTWVLGKMGRHEAISKYFYGVLAPFITSLIVGTTLTLSPKWKTIALSIITSNMNTALLKVAFGVGLILFPITATLQLFKTRFWLYQALAWLMRLIIDAISSTVFTCASVVSGVLLALGLLSLHEPDWQRSVASAIYGIFLMLITNVFAYWASKINHNPDKHLLGFAQEGRWARWLALGLALAMTGLGIHYLRSGERFCDVPTIKHAAGECPSQSG